MTWLVRLTRSRGWGSGARRERAAAVAAEMATIPVRRARAAECPGISRRCMILDVILDVILDALGVVALTL